MPREMQSLFDQPFSLPEAKKPDRNLENEMEGPVLRPANPWEF